MFRIFKVINVLCIMSGFSDIVGGVVSELFSCVSNFSDMWENIFEMCRIGKNFNDQEIGNFL